MTQTQTTPIKVHFFSANSTMGKAIAFITRSQFCHVGIQIGDKYYEEVDSGFRESAPRTDAAAVWSPQDAAVTPEALLFLQQTVGQRYSWSTIIADLIAAYTPFKWQIEAEGEHVCSGAVAWLLCLMGVLSFSKIGFQPDAVTPGQLATLLGVK